MRRGIPRWLEIVMAVSALVVSSPLFLIVAAAVALGSGRPVFFRQERVGRGGSFFVLYKFRTMAPVGTGPGVTAAGDRRITEVGRILRKLKLDELPELVNVLRGDMSFVGPRPEVPEYVQLSDPRWMRALEVRPGLTDPVTVSLLQEEEFLAGVDMDPERFYSEVLQPYKLKGYLDYLTKRSVWTDFVVLARTARAILVPHGSQRPELPELKDWGARDPERVENLDR